MNHRITNWLLIIGVMACFSACQDHQNVPGTQRLRIKTVQGGGVNTTYTYDSQNRLATQTNAAGSLYVYSYDDAQKKLNIIKQYPNPADQNAGTAILFPYNLDGSNFQARLTTINSSGLVETFTVLRRDYYVFDTDKHLVGLSLVGEPNGAGSLMERTFTYTGENITQGLTTAGRVRSYYTYEYDDKINPYYNSLDPDVDAIQKFSRNNLTKSSVADGNGQVYGREEFRYEYNQQGLPTKRIRGNEVLVYTYESY